MTTRRDLLIGAGATGVLAAGSAATAAPSGGDAALNKAFDGIVDRYFGVYPETATGLGLDKGGRAGLKAHLTDYSVKTRMDDHALCVEGLGKLAAIPNAQLSQDARTSKAVIAYALELGRDARRFDFGTNTLQSAMNEAQSPHVLDQQNGALHNVPEFLDSQHRVDTAADAEAYVSRVHELARALDAETERMRSYGITMAVATTLCFLAFASNDNWHDVCDALSPVWLTTVAGAAAMLFAISFAPAAGRWMRLALVVGAGAIAGGLYVGLFPQCFGHRLEGIPPEAERLWLSHVNEARPVYLHSVSVVVTMLTLPILGTIGSLIAVWRRRGTRAAADWLPVTLFATLATGLTLWQVRTGPSAQMLAVPGATYLAYRIVVGLMQSRSVAVRIGAVAAGLVVGAGLVSSMLIGALPQRYADLKFVTFWAIATGRQAPPAARKPLPGGKPKPDLTKLANRRCPTIPALAPIGRLPAATIFTFIDEGPRLITLTHHSAIGGPYHRNAQAILDIEHAFRGTPDQAHAIITAHHAAYLLVCPHMSEATIYQAEAPAGFYAKLAGGYTPSWLAPQPLPAGSPYRMWRVVG